MLSDMPIAYRRPRDSLVASLVLFLVLAASASLSPPHEKSESIRKRLTVAPTTGHLDDYYPRDFDPNVTEYWFDTVLDHFNFKPSPVATFPLRYYVNDQYYQNSSSPVLFYAGNEADIMQFVKNSGFLWEAAKELGGMVVFAEHRYYGKSFPFGCDDPKKSLTPENISYLTVEQAMADYHTLQLHIRKEWHMKKDAAFIVTGGSYGGNLALWMRLKNPNLWAGALASSATPLKHLLRRSNAFNKIVADVYMNVSRGCPFRIRKGLLSLFDNVMSEEGRAHIKETFNLCHIPEPKPGEEQEIAEDLHGWISGALETMVQYGYPYPTNFYNPVPAYPFKVACEAMLEEFDGLGSIAVAAQVYYNYSGQAGSCLDWLGKEQQHHYWNRLGQINRIRQRDWEAGLENDLGDDYVGTAWGYQCCTEVYQPMPTNGVTDFEIPHSVNKTEYFERCRKRWNGVAPRPNWEEMTFMSSNIQAGSNIFLTSGQLDPWRAAGIQQVPKGSPRSIVVRIIENGAHHLDLRSSNPLDPPSVVQVRQEEMQAMREWIQEWKELYPATSELEDILVD